MKTVLLTLVALLLALPASAQYAYSEGGLASAAPAVSVTADGHKTGTNSTSPTTWTLGASVPTGNLAVFVIGINQSFTISGVPSDNNGASDTWQCDQSLVSGNTLAICSTVASAPITSITWTGGGGSGQYAAYAAYATPVLTTGWADVGNKGTATTTGLTVTATGAATANDIVFAAFMATSTSDPTLTISTAGYTALFSDSTLVSNRYVTIGWIAASSGSTPTAKSNTTISVGQWGVLEAYKE